MTSGESDLSGLTDLPDPVRRYLELSVLDGCIPASRWVIRMNGRIKVGVWLPFEARQELDGSSFVWRARVPSDRFGILEVTDSYTGAEGGLVGRVAGRQLFADTSQDACRSAATRAVMESTMVPATLLPGAGVEWTAVSDSEIRFQRPDVPMSEEVTVRLNGDGLPLEVEAMRWLKEKDRPGSLVPFRCQLGRFEETAHQQVPVELTAGWVRERFEPFFKARITSLEGLSVP